MVERTSCLRGTVTVCFGGVRGCYVRATGVDRLQLLLLGGEGRLEQQISRLQREDVVVGVHAFDQLQGRGGHVLGELALMFHMLMLLLLPAIGGAGNSGASK